MAAHEYPFHPIPRRLRPCRQFCRGVSAAAHRRRSVAGQYRAVLQPHRLRRMAGPRVRRRHDPRGGGRHRQAQRAGRMRRRAVGLYGRGRYRRRHPGGGGDGEGGQPVGEVLLRPGDRRRRPRHFRARGHSRIYETEGGAGRRRDYAQPVRARLSRGQRMQDLGAGARRGAGGARARPRRGDGYFAARGGYAGGCDRPLGIGR